MKTFFPKKNEPDADRVLGTRYAQMHSGRSIRSPIFCFVRLSLVDLNTIIAILCSFILVRKAMIRDELHTVTTMTPLPMLQLKRNLFSFCYAEKGILPLRNVYNLGLEKEKRKERERS